MNSMQIKDKLRNIAKIKNVDFNIVLKFYVFDRFIARLSKSEYKDSFIIKGGFLISSLFGLDNRTTMDIDSLITKKDFNVKNILKMVNAIINIDLNDNISFFIKDYGTIMDDDEYGGFRIHLIFKFENIKESLKLDIATGDYITPKAIVYKYKTLLDNKYVNVWAYNIETILAEKIETIFSKVELNSRMKDYYDLYLIYHKEWNNINKEILKKAIFKTFIKRNFNNDIKETFKTIKDSLILRRKWKSYSKKYNYANEIEFNDIMYCINEIIKIIETVYV